MVQAPLTRRLGWTQTGYLTQSAPDHTARERDHIVPHLILTRSTFSGSLPSYSIEATGKPMHPFGRLLIQPCLFILHLNRSKMAKAITTAIQAFGTPGCSSLDF